MLKRLLGVFFVFFLGGNVATEAVTLIRLVAPTQRWLLDLNSSITTDTAIRMITLPAKRCRLDPSEGIRGAHRECGWGCALDLLLKVRAASKSILWRELWRSKIGRTPQMATLTTTGYPLWLLSAE